MWAFIIDFLPWMLFSVAVEHFGMLYAALLMMILIVVISHKHLIKGFVLDWGGLIFFALVALCAIPALHLPDLGEYRNFGSNLGLAAIMWISILIGKPFTRQYAMEQVDEPGAERSRLFKRITLYSALGWAVWLSILTALAGMHVFLGWSNASSNVISIIGYIVAAKLTGVFPDWYVGYNYRKTIANVPKPDTPYLKGNFAPVRDELNVSDLIVHGHIPKELHGAYMRNGPNPAFDPITYTYPFDGDGMIHAVYFENGKVRYKNRFIHTKAYENEHAVGHAIYPGIEIYVHPDPKLLTVHPREDNNNGAFINIVEHGGKLFAMLEAGADVYEVNHELETLGVAQFADGRAMTFNAHVHKDPENDDMWAIQYDVFPAIKFFQFDKKGELKNEYTHEKEQATMIHDFAFTKKYLIVFDCPAVFDFEAALNEEHDKILTWYPEQQTNILIFAKNTGELLHTFNCDNFFVYHFYNAYEENDRIIVDYIQHTRFAADETEFHLARATLQLANNSCDIQTLADIEMEFPRINEAYFSKPYRYGYAVEFDNENLARTLVKYDFVNRTAGKRSFGEDTQLDEPLFVAKANSQDEDDGYIMLYVYHSKDNNSKLYILDAKDIGREAIAVIDMPRRVPHGLHGNWIAM